MGVAPTNIALDLDVAVIYFQILSDDGEWMERF